MKNYCRGILNFALSRTALPYLNLMFQNYKTNLDSFRIFLSSRKSKINCIKQLREVLLIEKQDEEETVAMKSIFKDITIIFLKFFAPNWIYNSKISQKADHLKYRLRLLRRVRNPQYFTYLQGFPS